MKCPKCQFESLDEVDVEIKQDDEVSTLRTLQDYRKAISDLVQKHNGRVVDSPGDNLMAEFSSVVDSV